MSVCRDYVHLMAKRISNILWHIDTNRKVIGDTQTLEDVRKSLSNMLEEHERILGKKFE
jgi:signal-transduction protein with cAMP-binding, CBS, and nucleotidyltransferase domain